ncbi:MAG: hypothetical protein PHE55_00660 [Methylococcaceae bacterium]|nr:hypothetical protein [Methylococcaceae bacterium]
MTQLDPPVTPDDTEANRGDGDEEKDDSVPDNADGLEGKKGPDADRVDSFEGEDDLEADHLDHAAAGDDFEVNDVGNDDAKPFMCFRESSSPSAKSMHPNRGGGQRTAHPAP